MVEPQLIGPAGRDVAARAVSAQLIFMHVIANVATRATARDFIMNIAPVTGAAFERTVPGR